MKYFEFIFGVCFLNWKIMENAHRIQFMVIDIGEYSIRGNSRKFEECEYYWECGEHPSQSK